MRKFTVAVTQYISILSSILIKGICKNNLKIKNQWKSIYICSPIGEGKFKTIIYESRFVTFLKLQLKRLMFRKIFRSPMTKQKKM